MDKTQITIKQGALEGRLVTTDSGFQYDSFRGIPYARPPLGELRFRDPNPADGWEGMRDATNDGNANSQIDYMFTHKYMGEEDCLYLNVNVPHAAAAESPLAVMVWIHGGAFMMGSNDSSIYGVDNLVENNVIVVTINYRLGPLGFLCLHTAEAPGNVGLKDQVMALRWVKDNIEHFGGDPHNVTIFGESAGGASVGLMAVSPMAKGLYHKAIAQSGSCTSSWTISDKPEEVAFKLAEILGLVTTDKGELLKYLKNMPVENLVKASFSPDLVKAFGDMMFVPVLEKGAEGGAFLTQSPIELLKSGEFTKVPTICGFNSSEGFLFVHKFISEKGIENPTLEQLMPSMEAIFPASVSANLSEEQISGLMDKVKAYYFSSSGNGIEQYIDLLSDVGFNWSIYQVVKLISRLSSPTYYYMFKFNGSYNIFKMLSKYPYTGASHADELGYLFNAVFGKDIVPSDADILMIERMTQMWANFAKFGNPTPKLTETLPILWKPVTESEINCLSIDEEISIVQNPLHDRLKFWEHIFEQ